MFRQFTNFLLTLLVLLAIACGTSKGPAPQPSGGGFFAPESPESAEAIECGSALECEKEGYRLWHDDTRELAIEAWKRACEQDPNRCSSLIWALESSERHDELDELSKELCITRKLSVCGTWSTYWLTHEEPRNDTAMELIEAGCAQGELAACGNLAAVKMLGLVGPKDIAGGIRIHQETCDRGYEVSCSTLAYFFVTPGPGQDLERGLRMYEELCEDGVLDHCADLGDRYVKGRGVEKDVTKGLEYLEHACDSGSNYGCAFYGQALFDTAGDDNDIKFKAIDVLRTACAEDNPRSCWFAAQRMQGEAEPKLYYRRAYELFVKKCGDRKNGQACGIAATLIEREKVEGTIERVRDLKRRGCQYDSVVCDW